MPKTVVMPGITPKEAPYYDPDDVRRPDEFCPTQKRTGATEIC